MGFLGDSDMVFSLNGILCEIFSHPGTGCVGVLDKIFMKTPSQVICLISILHNVKIERAAVKGWGLTASMRRLQQHKNRAVLPDRLPAPCARGAGGGEKPWKWGTAFTLFCSFPSFHPFLHLSASSSYSICSLSLLPLGWLPLLADPPSFIICMCHFFFSSRVLYSLTYTAYLQVHQDSQTFLGIALRTRSHLYPLSTKPQTLKMELQRSIRWGDMSFRGCLFSYSLI